MGGVERLILKLTSASTGVGVEARAEFGNISASPFYIFKRLQCSIRQQSNLYPKVDKNQPGVSNIAGDTPPT